MFRFLDAAPQFAWSRGVVALSWFMFFAYSGLAAALTPLQAHGLALLPNGQMAGWGANEFAQVQAGQGDVVASPLRLNLPGTKPVAVSAGSRHSLALDENGGVWAWGDNSSGQLGLGHTRPVASPSVVNGLPGRALVVAAGMQHSAALLADGSVWVWGANNRGQMASGVADRFAVQAKPARVGALGKVLDIAAGDDFVVALVAAPAVTGGQREKTVASSASVWTWGAGATAPRLLEGIASATVVRAAGKVAMARTASGSYWLWSGGQAQPVIAQRQTFDRLGEMTHPLLAALTAQVAAERQPKPATVPMTNSTINTALPAKPVASVPTLTAPLAAVAPSSLPALSSVTPAASATLLPTLPPAAAPGPAVPAAAAVPAITAAAPPAPLAPLAPLPRVNLSGTVRLSSGFGGNSATSNGAPLENVLVSAEGAQCSSSDSQGRYVCSAPAGWSGRVSVRRNNYRFSPSALSFQNLRVDASQQDFAANYDPR